MIYFFFNLISFLNIISFLFSERDASHHCCSNCHKCYLKSSFKNDKNCFFFFNLTLMYNYWFTLPKSEVDIIDTARLFSVKTLQYLLFTAMGLTYRLINTSSFSNIIYRKCKFVKHLHLQKLNK